MEVADGIEKVAGTRIGNAYLVRVDDGVLIVDTSMPRSARRILDAVESLGYPVDEVRGIVLTHWHPDHMGSAQALRQATGAPISIHELDAPVLARRERPQKGRRAMGLLLRALRIPALEADRMLHAGDRIGGLEVIHVPGHTAGSIALRRADGVLLSGDALLPGRHGRVGPPDPGLSLDPDQATASAAALLALAPDVLLPGHGAPVRHSRA